MYDILMSYGGINLTFNLLARPLGACHPGYIYCVREHLFMEALIRYFSIL